jgi:hypothetical protein
MPLRSYVFMIPEHFGHSNVFAAPDDGGDVGGSYGGMLISR